MIVTLHTGRVEWCAYALKYSVGASVVVGSAIVTACKRSQLLVHWPEHISCKHCVHFQAHPRKTMMVSSHICLLVSAIVRLCSIESTTDTIPLMIRLLQ